MVLLFLSGSDLMLIMFIALLLFGGDKLPEIAKGLGKGIRDFKDASEGVKREINNQINSYDEKKAEAAAAAPAQLPPAVEQPAPVLEHGEGLVEDHNAPSPEVSSVANTMPFLDGTVQAADHHTRESRSEPSDAPVAAKDEPIKTTNV
jgi:sec-independent protein translocase protein TatA